MFSSIFASPSRRTIAFCPRLAKSKSPVCVSVLNALFVFGLVSVRLFPVSPQNGMHTLCLLDIKVKEPDFEKMARGKIAYLPPRYMTVSFGCSFIVVLTSPCYGSFIRREQCAPRAHLPCCNVVKNRFKCKYIYGTALVSFACLCSVNNGAARYTPPRRLSQTVKCYYSSVLLSAGRYSRVCLSGHENTSSNLKRLGVVDRITTLAHSYRHVISSPPIHPLLYTVSFFLLSLGKVGTALEQLLEVEARKGEEVYGPGSLCVGLARLGQPTQKIVAGTMR